MYAKNGIISKTVLSLTSIARIHYRVAFPDFDVAINFTLLQWTHKVTLYIIDTPANNIIIAFEISLPI